MRTSLVVFAVVVFLAAASVVASRRLPNVSHLKPTFSTIPMAKSSKLPKLDTMPEISGISSWINSEPLTRADLKGKVVLVDFWTYSCINCIRTLPYVTAWYDTYKDQGFVVLGVHTPEFAFEKVRKNVAAATAK